MAKSESNKTRICVITTFLLSAGLIAVILVVLMTPEIPSLINENDPDENEPTIPMEGEFVYAEVPGVGKIKGGKSKFGAVVFAGIPFAEPPVGERRWAKPVKAPPLFYDGEYYDATSSKPACPQVCTLPSPQYVCPKEDEMDEDCLSLAFYLPSTLTKEISTSEGHYFELIDSITTAAYPVMVFLHGGAFISGSNGVTLYDGQFIAEKGDVIVVVVNYRLGPFGFFYQNNDASDPILGNFGIWDQILALEWVRDKITYFGGDNEKVTLFGESAGAQSIAVHLSNSYSEPLFNRAILQSNPFGITFKTTDEAQTLCDNFVQHMRENSTNTISCEANDVDCLRDISMEDLLKYYENFRLRYQFNKESLSQLFEPWAPILDGDLLSKHPFYLLSEVESHYKPMMFGFTNDEGIFFVAQALSNASTEDVVYRLLLQALFGDNATDVAREYPADCPVGSGDGEGGSGEEVCDNRLTMDDVVTDYMFTCPHRRVFNQGKKFGNPDLNVWWYTLDQPWSFYEFWEEYTVCYNLTCHAAELPYLFDLDDLITDFSFTDAESELADKMIYYWTNFAKSGNPNEPMISRTFRPKFNGRNYPPAVKYWPRMYEKSTTGNVIYNTMKLSDSTKGGEVVIQDFQKDLCDFWDEIDLYLKDDIKIDLIFPKFKEFFQTRLQSEA